MNSKKPNRARSTPTQPAKGPANSKSQILAFSKETGFELAFLISGPADKAAGPPPVPVTAE